MILEQAELIRQNSTLNFIASENYPSEDILEANASIFQVKYAEGFPYKRYYQGCDIIDDVEQDCIDKCLRLFDAEDEYLANVQPNSGSSANITVYHALLKPQDIVLTPDTASLGHVSHGIKGSFLDTYFNVVRYGLDNNGIIDYDRVEELAMVYKPNLIICGASNYSQIVDFKRFKEIANKCGAVLMADISHIAGLVVTSNHPTPIGYADIITTTLHKTLRGTRSAVILYKKEFDKDIRFATIPGLWGGANFSSIYAKTKTFEEAMKPEFKEYMDKVIDNTNTMASVFTKYSIPMVSNGTKNHLLCLDLTKYNVNGKELAVILEECGVVANCNAIPNDTSFIKPHGLRIGCAPVTTRGLNTCEVAQIAKCISDIILYFEDSNDVDTCKFETLKDNLKNIVKDFTEEHPIFKIYPNMYKKNLVGGVV